MSADAKPSAGVAAGQVLAGKYRIEKILGAGGMGVVVAAHHLQLDERVALKFLLPEALGSPEAVARFAREARAAVKIKSEHVARVTDVGQLENGAPYMVMEYLEGSDLSTWLEDRGRLPIDQAVDFILQASEALADAHALGIVHRDLKPANLFCIRRSDGQLSIKVLDFGISKLTSASAVVPDMTRTSTVMGSPYYMSPEQMRASKEVDARADIWALGVILFELVTGRAPFIAETVTDLAIKIATEPAVSARSLRADVAPELAQVIAKCLTKDRAQRYQNVSELAVALKDFGSRRAAISVERILGTHEHARLAPVASERSGMTGVAAPHSTLASFGKTGTSGRPSGRLVAGAVFVATAAIVALGGFFVARRDTTPPLSPATAEETRPASASVATSALALDPQPAAPDLPVAAGDSPDSLEGRHATGAPIIAVASSTPPPPAPTATSLHTPAKPHPAVAPAPTKPAALPTAKPNCNPAYVIDSAGHRQYKPECL